VNNSGKMAGKEVVQVYVGKPESGVERAQKELKAFQKVMVGPGKSATASLTIDVDALAYYNEDISDWSLEKGEYILYIGNASDHITQELRINIE
jgi:beta-glucosidase